MASTAECTFINDNLTGVDSPLEAREIWFQGILASQLLLLSILWPAVQLRWWKSPTWAHTSGYAWLSMLLVILGSYTGGFAAAFTLILCEHNSTSGYGAFITAAIVYPITALASLFFHNQYVLLYTNANRKKGWAYYLSMIWQFLAFAGWIVLFIFAIGAGSAGISILAAFTAAFVLVFWITNWWAETAKAPRETDNDTDAGKKYKAKR